MDAIKRKALEQLLGQSQKLSPDDFTRPGEMIPKDAGLMDFLRYNAAHFNPNDPEVAMSMGMGSGGINKLGGLIQHLPAAANEFHAALSSAQEARPLISKMITKYSPKEYSEMKTFLSPDKLSGYAIKPDGELVSVFSAAKGRGNDIVSHAIENGATKLDNFDGHLTDLYKRHGFEEYRREPNYTPGEPDVVYMAKREAHPEFFESEKTAPGREISSEEIEKADRLQSANRDLANMMGKTQEEFQRQYIEPYDLTTRGSSTHIPPGLSKPTESSSIIPGSRNIQTPVPSENFLLPEDSVPKAAGFAHGGEVRQALIEHFKKLRG